jgi:hypothetical protein
MFSRLFVYDYAFAGGGGVHVPCNCLLMCVLKSTRKRTNRLQYSVCKCEVESIGKWSNISVLFNQPHFNLVPKV